MDEGQRAKPMNHPPASDSGYADAHRQLQDLRALLDGVIVGQGELVTHLVTAVFAGGHVLIEGLPGLGKTHLAKALAAPPTKTKLERSNISPPASCGSFVTALR